MNTEYEGLFFPVDKDAMRKRLAEAGAKLEAEEFDQKRVVTTTPSGDFDGKWIRIRKQGDTITLAYKEMNRESKTIEDQKEIEFGIDSLESATDFVVTLGCKIMSEQETKREVWMLDGVEVSIDTWPWLDPFVEVEGPDEVSVKRVSEKLGFAWNEAIFDNSAYLYTQVYNVSMDEFNYETPKVLFSMDAPWERRG